MKEYSVSLDLTVVAKDEAEAKKAFWERVEELYGVYADRVLTVYEVQDTV
jgi:hypothetical protein